MIILNVSFIKLTSEDQGVDTKSVSQKFQFTLMHFVKFFAQLAFEIITLIIELSK